MKKIETFTAVAPKLKSGKLELEYCLWTNTDGALYVQIVRNLTNTASPGTHSNLLFRVSDYLNGRNTENASQEMRGINPETFSEETPRDNNNTEFVKAVLRHLFP